MNYDIESHHYNVGAGDAAIHLLVQKTADEHSIIHRAVLVDGGPQLGSVVLQEAIKRFSAPGFYSFPGDTVDKKQTLRFDSIVCTHFDGDHYQGIKLLLQSDFQARRKPLSSAASLASSYIKYDQSTGLPTTVFYAPYWFDIQSYTRGIGQDKPPEWRWHKDDNGLWLDVCIGDVKEERDWVKSVARLCCTPGHGANDASIGMLGRKFFFNQAPWRAKANPLDIKTVHGLVTGMPIGVPAMYCIGADSVLIGTGAVDPRGAKPPTGKPLADTPEVIDKGTGTKVNRSSIICILVNKAGQVIHYFGGDAAYQVEQHIPSLLSDGINGRIPVMKLGHHGAASSSPTVLLDALLPHYVVASAGGSYGHPRFEVLMYLAALYHNQGPGKGIWIGDNQVLATTYPYWFTSFSKWAPTAVRGGGKNQPWIDALALLVVDKEPFIQGLMFKNLIWTIAKKDSKILSMQIQAWCKTWWDCGGSGVGPDKTALSCATHQKSKAGGRYELVVKSRSIFCWWLEFWNGTLDFRQRCLPYGETPREVRFSLPYRLTDIKGATPENVLPRRLPDPSSIAWRTKGGEKRRLLLAAEPTTSTAADAEPEPAPKKSKVGGGDDSDGDDVMERRDDEDEQDEELAYMEDEKTEMQVNGKDDDHVVKTASLGKPGLATPASGPKALMATPALPPPSRDGGPLDTTYWFASQSWFGSSYVVQGQTTFLVENSDLDNFVFCLTNSAVAIDSRPAQNAAPKTPISVSPADMWYYWLALFQNVKPTKFALEALTSGAADLQGFKLKLDVQTADSVLSTFEFSSEMSQAQLTPAAPATNSLSPEGVVKDTGMIVLGLASTDPFPSSLTISQIAHIVQFRSGKEDQDTTPSASAPPAGSPSVSGPPVTSPPTTIPTPPGPGGQTGSLDPAFTQYDYACPLYGLDEALTLSLDLNADSQGQGPRNCLWFSAADAYKTYLRLQFKLDQGAVQSWVQGLLASDGVLLPTPPVIIARKQGWPRYGTADLKAVVSTDPADAAGSSAVVARLAAHITLHCLLQIPNSEADPAHKSSFEFELFFVFGMQKLEIIFLNDSIGQDADVGNMLKSFAHVLPGLDKLDLPNISDHLPGWVKAIEDIVLREVRVSMGTDASTGKMAVLKVYVEFEIPFNFNGTECPFHVSFTYPNSTFIASLWLPPAPATTIFGSAWEAPLLDVRCLPEYEAYRYRMPKYESLQQTGILLSGLVPGRDSSKVITPPPAGIDVVVKLVTIQVQINPLAVQFEAAIGYGTPQDPTVAVPPIIIDTVDLMASYDGADLQLSLHVSLEITPPPTEENPQTVLLVGQFDYDDTTAPATVAAGSSRWSFTGRVQNLHLSYLWDFLDTNARDLLVEILHPIVVQYLVVTYTYSLTGQNTNSKSFSFDGQINIADLALRLTYNWDDSGWEFRGVLGAADKTSSLKEILHALCGDVADLIPDCCDISLGQIAPPDPVSGTGTTPQFLDGADATKPAVVTKSMGAKGSQADIDELLIFHKPNALPTPNILFAFNISLSNGRCLTLIQIQYQGKDKASSPPPKRIVRFTLESLPAMDSVVPTVDHLPQPFDKMEFVWVNDDSQGPSRGISRADFNLFNDQSVLPSDLFIPFKDTFKPPGTTADILLATGCHFILNKGETAVLDYAFGAGSQSPQAQAQPQSGPSAASGALVKAAADDPPQPQPTAPTTADDAASKTTMAPLQITFGPLTIANVGLQLSNDANTGNDVISLHLDATLQIGPIGFGVLGLHIDFGFSPGSTVENFLDLKGISVNAHLDGLQADFNQPPLTVAGLFQKTLGIYRGGVLLTMEAYSFLAVGSYGVMEQDQDQKVYPQGGSPPGATVTGTFKSVFIFGELDGPIADLGFLEVLGVKLGFGYNSNLRNPDLGQLANFPLIQNPFAAVSESSAPQNPMDLLMSFSSPVGQDPAWVTPQDNVLWFALGLTIVAFELLTVTAMVVVDLQPSVILNIFADAVAAMPGDGTNSDDSYLFVEIQIVSSVNFGQGAMLTDGKLAPNSFVLDPVCHLGGQFGMRYWFGDSPFAGDWVYTVGGYHPAFAVPPNYPACDRMTISWQLDSNLSITGAAYFAITPKAAMGGGSLNAVFSLGPLGAHFDAYADFLINFNPFYFIGDIGVTVGVDFSMDLLFCTLNISADICATLHVEGPAFGGVAHVDFWVFGFDIAFGAQPVDHPALPWDQFWDLLTQNTAKGGGSSSSTAVALGALATVNAASTTGSNTSFIYNVVAGSVPSNAAMHTPPQGTSLPAQAATPPAPAGPSSGGTSSTPVGTVWTVRSGTFKFRVETKVPYTHWSVNSDQPIAVTGSPAFFIKPMQVTEAITSSVLSATISGGPPTPGGIGTFRVMPVTRKAPTSIWSQYDSGKDPSIPGGDYTDLLKPDDPTLDLPMVLEILVPKPAFLGTIPAYDGTTAMVQNVFALDVAPGGTVPNPAIPCATPATTPLGLPAYRCKADGTDLTISTWTGIAAAWTATASAPVRPAAVQKWVDFFGWGKGLGSDLNAAVPAKLVAGIEQDFMSAPFVY